MSIKALTEFETSFNKPKDAATLIQTNGKENWDKKIKELNSTIDTTIGSMSFLGIGGMDATNQQMVKEAQLCIIDQSEALFAAAATKQNTKSLLTEYSTLLGTQNKLKALKANDKEKTTLIKNALIDVLSILIRMYTKINPNITSTKIEPKPYVMAKDSFTDLWEHITTLYELKTRKKKKDDVVGYKKLPFTIYEAQKLASIFEKLDPAKDKKITPMLSSDSEVLISLLKEAVKQSHAYLTESFLKNDKLAHKVIPLDKYEKVVTTGLTLALEAKSPFRFIKLLIDKGAIVDDKALLTLLTVPKVGRWSTSIATFSLENDMTVNSFFKDAFQEKREKDDLYKTVVLLQKKKADTNAEAQDVNVLRGALRNFYNNVDDESLKIIDFLLENKADATKTKWHGIFTANTEKKNNKNLTRLINILAKHKNIPWDTIIDAESNTTTSKNDPTVFIRALTRLNDSAVAKKIYAVAPRKLCKAIDPKNTLCEKSFSDFLKLIKK